MNKINTIAILSPGDMGHAVGRVLGEGGLRVIANLHDRSARTRELAAQANIEEVGDDEALVREADLLLSILVPAQAAAAATRIAHAVRATGASLVYADCNAVAPQTVQRIADELRDAGAGFVDGSIIGPPPRQPGSTRFYASGPDVDALLALNERGLHVIGLGDEVRDIGQASAIKMCYAALTKGLTALSTELLVAAERLEVGEALAAEFAQSQAELHQRMARSLPSMPAKSRRWVGEMEEIAATFEGVGLTGLMMTGAAEMYRFIGETALAEQTPEAAKPSLAEVVEALAEASSSSTRA